LWGSNPWAIGSLDAFGYPEVGLFEKSNFSPQPEPLWIDFLASLGNPEVGLFQKVQLLAAARAFMDRFFGFAWESRSWTFSKSPTSRRSPSLYGSILWAAFGNPEVGLFRKVQLLAAARAFMNRFFVLRLGIQKLDFFKKSNF
jgi:hypothetical protein